jgi:hypothetical protein
VSQAGFFFVQFAFENGIELLAAETTYDFPLMIRVEHAVVTVAGDFNPFLAVQI